MDGVQIIIIIVNILPVVVVVAIKTGATVVMIVVVERRKKVFMCRLMNAAGSSRVTSTAEGQRQQPQHRMTIMKMMECGNQRTRVCEEEWEVEWCCIVRFGQSSSLVSFLLSLCPSFTPTTQHFRFF